MSTPVVGGASQSNSSTQTPTRISGTRDLGQDAFLKLLATFSSLEKLTTIATKLDQIGTALGLTMTDPADSAAGDGGSTKKTDGASGGDSATGTGSGNSGSGTSTGTSGSTTNGGK